MTKALNLNEQIRYVLFREIYLRYSDPKAKRKAFTLIEGAIDCFDRKGFENATMLMIARESGVTSPLLKYYFTDLEDIRLISLQYIHLIAQKVIIEPLKESEGYETLLHRYLTAHYRWMSNFQSHARVWISFLASSCRNKNFRQLNTSVTLNGRTRIEKILSEGRRSGAFSHLHDQTTATLIQTLLNGWFLTMMTETIDDRDAFTKKILSECERLVGLPNS